MSETREAARQRARELRAEHRKRDRRRRLAWGLGITGGVLVVAVVVTLVLVTTTRPSQRPPEAADRDGFTVSAQLLAEDAAADAAPAPTETPAAAAVPTPTPTPTEADGDAVDIEIFYDYVCPNCGEFQSRNGAQLRAWLEQGAVTVTYHPLAIFNSKSAGTQYAARAANAAACVAQYSPAQFLDFHEALYAHQPGENDPGYSDDELVQLATDAGVQHLGQIAPCIAEGRFRGWVKAATDRALKGPIEGTSVPAIEATPTIIVNGDEFEYTTAFDPNEFAQFVAKAAGQSFSQKTTPTPTPTPTPAP